MFFIQIHYLNDVYGSWTIFSFFTYLLFVVRQFLPQVGCEIETWIVNNQLVDDQEKTGIGGMAGRRRTEVRRGGDGRGLPSIISRPREVHYHPLHPYTTPNTTWPTTTYHCIVTYFCQNLHSTLLKSPHYSLLLTSKSNLYTYTCTLPPLSIPTGPNRDAKND